jgi:HKD family nuclease
MNNDLDIIYERARRAFAKAVSTIVKAKVDERKVKVTGIEGKNKEKPVVDLEYKSNEIKIFGGAYVDKNQPITTARLIKIEKPQKASEYPYQSYKYKI